MKHKASISHDEAMVRELRENPGFAAEYLRAALDRDGRGEVYLACDKELQRKVALKSLRADLTGDKRGVLRVQAGTEGTSGAQSSRHSHDF